MSTTIVAVQLLAAELSTHPRCATLQDRHRERGALRLTTPALSSLRHDLRTIFRRELRKLSYQTLQVAHITSHTRKLSEVADRGKDRLPPGCSDSVDLITSSDGSAWPRAGSAPRTRTSPPRSSRARASPS